MAKVLHGTTAGEQLNVSEDNAQAYGLKGNDTLVSDGKSDVLLVGGSGDDSLIVMGGEATLSGGDGSDTFELNYSADKKLSAVIEDLQPSQDKIVVNFDGSSTPQLSAQSISGGDVVLQDDDGLFKVTLKSVRDNDYFDDEASEQVWQVLELTNAEREAASLSPLTLSDGLTAAASIRAEEITELGEKNELDIFRHNRPRGGEYKTVFKEVGKEYHHHAENITAGEATAQDAVNDWMNSPAHRKNILDEEHRNYSKLGVGYNEDDTDPSDQRFYWLQLFADSLRNDISGNFETVTAEELLNASIEPNTVSKFIAGDDEPNTIENNFYGVTISALGGNDSIINSGLNVSISGGADDDTILSGGSFATIAGNAGNDLISLSSDAKEILIEYALGDGNDSISGLNSTDTLSISGSEFTPATVGNDIIVGVGSDSITLFGAASSGVQIEGARSKLLIGTEDADYIENTLDAAALVGLGGNDSIFNYYGANVSIDAGADDDFIYNGGSNISIDAGAGDDYIYNYGGENVLFFYESGNDTIGGFNETSTLKIAEGSLSSVTSDDDLILTGEDGSIKILDAATLSSIKIFDANDNPVTPVNPKNIVGTEGDDSIVNTIRGATIQPLGGNDSIQNNQQRGTIYIYGGGLDTIEGFNDSDTLDLGDYAWETLESDNNILVNIISNDSTVGTVTLKDYPSDQEVNILSSYVKPSVPGEEISNSTDSTLITGTTNDDTIQNSGSNVTIQALGGNDSIDNDGGNASIDAGAGNDSIFSIANNNSIITGKGNDYVGTDWSYGTVFIYGGGNDTIDGFRVTNNFLVIEGYDWEINYYEGATVEWTESFLINVLDGSETVGTIFLPNTNSSENKWNIVSSKDDVEPYNLVIHDNSKFADGTYSGNDNTLLAGTNNKDFITNFAWRNVTIFAGAGDDIIENTTGYGDFDGQLPENASIDGGTGNDYISNNGNSSTINGGAGNDTIYSTSSAVSSIIDAGAGNDYISNNGNSSTINGGDGDDEIDIYGDSVTINAGAGKDTIYNGGDSVTIDAGAGNDFIDNWGGSNVTIDLGAGNDRIYNEGGNNVSILGGSGNDTINITGYYSTLWSDGAESIDNWNSSNVSILGGTGDDQINLFEDSRNNFVRYADGDGNDTVWGITGNDTLNILAEPSAISSLRSGEDIIVRVGEGEILLVGARNHPPHITIGESGTSGGHGGHGGGGSSGTSGTSSGQGSNTSGGTSASANSNSDASGGLSASGSSGTSATSGGNGSSGRGNSSSTAGTSITNPITIPETSTTTRTTTNSNPFNTSVTTTQGTYSGTKMSPLDRVYTGNNKIIQHYGSWRKITFDEIYRGAHFDGAGNFIVESSTGHLVFENATDKVINLKDAAGNDFIKAHMSSTAGTVDGRIYSGYQILNGSLGEDLIFAGADGSQLWGNADTASDTLVGGDGSDIFISGKNEGSDTFQNASSADVVNLNDTSLSDIVSTNTRDGALVISFNTGNTLTVQSTEALSANIVFSDGTNRRFNHATNSWQTE